MYAAQDEEIEPYVRRQNSPRSAVERKRKLDELDAEAATAMRTTINSRERRRMHDLNEALQELRDALPYHRDGQARRMSKINTLLLAQNCILQLRRENAALRAELSSMKDVVTQRPAENGAEKKAIVATTSPAPLWLLSAIPKQSSVTSSSSSSIHSIVSQSQDSSQ